VALSLFCAEVLSSTYPPLNLYKPPPFFPSQENTRHPTPQKRNPNVNPKSKKGPAQSNGIEIGTTKYMKRLAQRSRNQKKKNAKDAKSAKTDSFVSFALFAVK